MSPDIRANINSFHANAPFLYTLKLLENQEVIWLLQGGVEIRVKEINDLRSQPIFTCLKLAIETLEQGVKYIQS